MNRTSARRRDYLSIVEAAYALDISEEDWVQGIAEASRPVIDAGLGAIAYTYDASDVGSVRIGAYTQAGGPVSLEREARAFVTSLSAAQVRRFYSASPPTELMRRIFRVAPPAESSIDFLRKGPTVVMDAVGIRGHNPDARGCVISAPSQGAYALAPRTRASLDRVALHLAAAFRLRSSQGERDALSQADAVFSSKGKLEHRAESTADQPTALHRAVERRLLGQRIRSEEPERALDLWRALVAGRWSVVDHVDSDGKRFILARRNRVQLENPATLEYKERLVALYTSWGHSNKLIAYELGLSPSTVSALLQSALRKLRLRSRTELVRIFAADRNPREKK